MNGIYGIIVCLVGVFSVMASVKNWNFFFNNRKARPFVAIFGRDGARIFYGALGVFLIILGIIFSFAP